MLAADPSQSVVVLLIALVVLLCFVLLPHLVIFRLISNPPDGQVMENAACSDDVQGVKNMACHLLQA
jgi:hypothetical protein